MSFNHAIVWIDHREAHVIQFNADASETETIKTHSKHQHLHHHQGTLGSGRIATDPAYLQAVIESLAGVKEVLVVGPGSAKLELIKHVHHHAPQVAEKIIGVETIDHPTDPQLLAYAKRYFLKIDKMRGDNF
jgi:stalled ribosome rescue protein Dom34